MSFPLNLPLFGQNIPSHSILETLSYFIGYRFYLFLKHKWKDDYGDEARLNIFVGAILGAAIGSKLLGFLEHKILWSLALENIIHIMAAKTILGGLIGGTIGVEIVKFFCKIKRSSGDLYVFPIILGIIIGRIGCFLDGVNDGTWGNKTSFIMGIDGGDGVLRHPTPLYEIIFLSLLFISLWKIKPKIKTEGDLYKIFLGSYCFWRFSIEFIKPIETHTILNLSFIQMASILMIVYYFFVFIMRRKRRII